MLSLPALLPERDYCHTRRARAPDLGTRTDGHSAYTDSGLIISDRPCRTYHSHVPKDQGLCRRVVLRQGIGMGLKLVILHAGTGECKGQ